MSKSPNGDAAEMDENGLWIKPDMPIEDKFKSGGAVGTLLGMARKLRARGGQVMGVRALGHPHVGPVEGPTGGRTDALPISVPHNAYVVPADVVSHYGEGNTAAGMQVMKKMFGNYHSPNGTSMSMGHLSGHANGGGVPIKISDGEYVVSPEEVARRGGGSFDIGNRALDQFVLKSRQAHIDTLSKLPGPAQ